MAASKITIEDATKAKAMYMEGRSLADICTAFPGYTRNQWRSIKVRDNWDAERQSYSQSVQDDLKARLTQNKDRLGESLALLATQLHKKVVAGAIRIETVTDVEKLLKTIFLHLNDGTEKNQLQITSGVDWRQLAQTLLKAEGQDASLFQKLGMVAK